MNALKLGRTRLIVGGAALLVVLAVASVALAARTLLTPSVTAATPPSAVRVTVSEDTRLSHSANGDQQILAHPIHTIRYQRTITDPVKVRELEALVNEVADGQTPLPTCKVDSLAATTPVAPSYIGMDTYDFVFTAHDTPVEHAVISFRCGGAGVQRGFVPALTLGSEQGLGSNWWQIFPATIWPAGGPYTTPLHIHG